MKHLAYTNDKSGGRVGCSNKPPYGLVHQFSAPGAGRVHLGRIVVLHFTALHFGDWQRRSRSGSNFALGTGHTFQRKSHEHVTADADGGRSYYKRTVFVNATDSLRRSQLRRFDVAAKVAAVPSRCRKVIAAVNEKFVPLPLAAGADNAVYDNEGFDRWSKSALRRRDKLVGVMHHDAASTGLLAGH